MNVPMRKTEGYVPMVAARKSVCRQPCVLLHMQREWLERAFEDEGILMDQGNAAPARCRGGA